MSDELNTMPGASPLAANEGDAAAVLNFMQSGNGPEMGAIERVGANNNGQQNQGTQNNNQQNNNGGDQNQGTQNNGQQNNNDGSGMGPIEKVNIGQQNNNGGDQNQGTQNNGQQNNGQQGAFDGDAFLRETLGEEHGFKSFDHFKQSLPEVMKTLGGANQMIDTLTQTNNLYKTEMEKVGQIFANEDINKFNTFVKETNITDYGFFSRIKDADLSTLSDIDVLVLKDKSSGANIDEAVSRRVLQNKYDTSERDFSEIEDEAKRAKAREAHNDQVLINKANLQREASLARNELKTYQEKIKAIDVKSGIETSINQSKEAREAAGQAWAPIINQASERAGKYPLVIPDGNGSSFQLGDFDLPKEAVTRLGQLALNFAVDNGLDVQKQEDLSKVNGYMGRTIREYFWPQIMAKVAAEARTLSNEDWEKKYANASGATLPITQNQNDMGGGQRRTEQQTDREMVDEVIRLM